MSVHHASGQKDGAGISSTKSAACCLTAATIGQLRADELTPDELSLIEAHLGQCAACQRALDNSAADAAEWGDLRASLTDRIGPADDSPAPNASIGEPGESHSYEPLLGLLGPTDDPRMLGRIGSYEVVGILGRGGMGVVFKAFDAALNRYVAIKMLLPHLAATGAARKRFAREAQAAAGVVDDHVMPIHGVDEWQGNPYLVMPYARGMSLQKRLSAEGPLETREVLRIGMQTALALAAAHAQGLVHRDVKPANILLADGVERVTLTDFGLARAADDMTLTRTGVLAGTPPYMSPEQARGQTIDVRSDLFSLGSVLYATCTGRAPFQAESSYGVLRLITDDEPRPIREINPDAPEWLCDIIRRLMAKQPDERFASATEVAELLEGCLAHVQNPTGIPLPAGARRPQARRPRPYNAALSKTAGLAATIVASCLFGAFLWQATDPPDISGVWSGDEWGAVELKQSAPGEYQGAYSETHNDEPGEVRLTWSRVERRFNGAWSEGANCHGEVSLRLADGEIRGSFTTDASSKIEPGVKPKLGDIHMARVAGGDVSTREIEAEYLRFEGTWRIVERSQDGKPVTGEFGQGGFHVVKNRRMGEGLIKLDPSKTPREIDLVFTAGPEKGMVVRGIYHWDVAASATAGGDRLLICTFTERNPTDPARRPRDFKSGPGIDAAIWERAGDSAQIPTPDRPLLSGETEVNPTESPSTFDQVENLDSARAPKLNDDEYQRFEGAWRIVTRRIDRAVALREFGKDGVHVIKDRQLDDAMLRLNPSKTPREIDLVYTKGPHKGAVLRGIYEWDKYAEVGSPRDRVVVCFSTNLTDAANTANHRPQDIEAGNQVDFSIWERTETGDPRGAVVNEKTPPEPRDVEK